MFYFEYYAGESNHLEMARVARKGLFIGFLIDLSWVDPFSLNGKYFGPVHEVLTLSDSVHDIVGA
jgi:hypothetical protein